MSDKETVTYWKVCFKFVVTSPGEVTSVTKFYRHENYAREVIRQAFVRGVSSDLPNGGFAVIPPHRITEVLVTPTNNLCDVELSW